jgi:hypothetical protein
MPFLGPGNGIANIHTNHDHPHAHRSVEEPPTGM